MEDNRVSACGVTTYCERRDGTGSLTKKIFRDTVLNTICSHIPSEHSAPSREDVSAASKAEEEGHRTMGTHATFVGGRSPVVELGGGSGSEVKRRSSDVGLSCQR